MRAFSSFTPLRRLRRKRCTLPAAQKECLINQAPGLSLWTLGAHASRNMWSLRSHDLTLQPDALFLKLRVNPARHNGLNPVRLPAKSDRRRKRFAHDEAFERSLRHGKAARHIDFSHQLAVTQYHFALRILHCLRLAMSFYSSDEAAEKTAGAR